jgi:hypothetical protein
LNADAPRVMLRAMPLDHYGVAIGTYVSFTRDPTHDFGHWYHGHVALSAAGVPWTSALDVDAPASVGVSYRIVTDLDAADLGPLATASEGWHDLAPTATSGALDYVRSPRLQDGGVWRTLLVRLRPAAPAGWRPPPPDIGQPGVPPPPVPPDPAPFTPGRADALLRRLMPLRRLFPQPWRYRLWRSFPWVSSNGDNALDALAPFLTGAARIYLFGQRYTDGTDGVHDVHLNQGDPAGSPWYATNGPWQDGCVACQRADGSVTVWQVKFDTQVLTTNADGHPR